ncbi:hypothetical protein [Paenibacillus daejeonensis]|uniref:hypothetical protein n=1 Tax=Paenibacillus daejeonensis TaxID=135193 RepID=UPI001B7FD470|nr:hypothetical protein [Paenibacillus daejeonensis]
MDSASWLVWCVRRVWSEIPARWQLDELGWGLSAEIPAKRQLNPPAARSQAMRRARLRAVS